MFVVLFEGEPVFGPEYLHRCEEWVEQFEDLEPGGSYRVVDAESVGFIWR